MNKEKQQDDGLREAIDERWASIELRDRRWIERVFRNWLRSRPVPRVTEKDVLAWRMDYDRAQWSEALGSENGYIAEQFNALLAQQEQQSGVGSEATTAPEAPPPPESYPPDGDARLPAMKEKMDGDYVSPPATDEELPPSAASVEIKGVREVSSIPLENLQRDIYKNAIDKGFYEPVPPTDLERIALMHEELGEASSALRVPQLERDEHCPDYLNLEVELADCIIRILDYAEFAKLRVIEAMLAKHEYNKTRPYKHGKKC